MECSSSKCVKPDSDRTVSCWLCLGYYHLKCSGSNMRARDADALADSQKFLHWTCLQCRNVGIEFYNLFKSSKEEFEKINKEFLSVQKKLASFGELFVNYKNLDKFMNSLQNMSPKNKNKNFENVATQCSLPPASCSIEPSESKAVNSVPSLLSTAVNRTNVPIIENTENLFYTPTTTALQPIFNNENLNIANSSNFIPSNENHANNFINVDSPIVALNNTPNRNVPRPLRVIPPNKTVFISRLASDTTAEDVEYYIKSKCGADCFSSVHKFSFAEPRTVSSFKITVPDEIFKEVVAADFWPIGTIVREFIFKQRPRNTVRLPASLPSMSKN